MKVTQNSFPLVSFGCDLRAAVEKRSSEKSNRDRLHEIATRAMESPAEARSLSLFTEKEGASTGRR
jgi:hypothetical protein